LSSQNTFYVDNLKGVGRIYQQTFIDTYSKVDFAKLYTTKTPITVIVITMTISCIWQLNTLITGYVTTNQRYL